MYDLLLIEEGGSPPEKREEKRVDNNRKGIGRRGEKKGELRFLIRRVHRIHHPQRKERLKLEAPAL